MVRLFCNWDRYKIGQRLSLTWPENLGPELPVGSVRKIIHTRRYCRIVVSEHGGKLEERLTVIALKSSYIGISDNDVDYDVDHDVYNDVNNDVNYSSKPKIIARASVLHNDSTYLLAYVLFKSASEILKIYEYDNQNNAWFWEIDGNGCIKRERGEPLW